MLVIDLYLDQSRPDAGARLFVMSSSPDIPGGGLCTCRLIKLGVWIFIVEQKDVDEESLCLQNDVDDMVAWENKHVEFCRGVECLGVWIFNVEKKYVDEESLCLQNDVDDLVAWENKHVEFCRGVEHGWDLDGQAVSPSFATCKGYDDSTQVLSCRFESRGKVTAFGSSRPFIFVIRALRPLDLCESWPLDQISDPDLVGASLLCADVLVGVMAEEQTPASTSNTDGDDYAWVADEPRTTVSKFSLNGGEGMFRTVQHSPTDDWKACIPNTNRRICSKFQWGSFPMYQIAFEQMGYRLPFSDFEVAVFRYLHLTPSQLHPNSLAFIRAFEMTASYLGFMPTIPLFFHAFHLQRSRPKGDAANKFGWVSLKQSTKLFEMFLESVRGFKDSYFFIKPLNSVSWQSIIYRGPAKDATGAPLIGPDGRPILEDYSRFPLSWRKSHYLKPASDFIYSTEELTIEELSNYEQMKVFVGSFPRKTYEDEDGNFVLDDSGAPLTKKCFIDTRRLLACKSSAEMEACFREMSSIAAKLRKSKAAKEKRQAAVLGSSSTAAPSPGGSDMDNVRGGPAVVDLDGAVANTIVDNPPRPPKVARVGEGDASVTGQIPPSSRFMLPPAIGSPDLVKKSSVSISDAEKAILDDMGPEALKNELTDAMVSAFKLMEISSYLNGRECKYLAERDSAKEEVALLRQTLEQAKTYHAAYKDRYKLQAGLVTQLTEKEKEAARLVEEKAELEGRIKDLTSEKETLEGRVKNLESRSCSSGTAPDSDELVVDPNGEYKGFTRAALVSRIFELEGKELDVAKSSFDNAVAQLMVLNPGVELVVEGASELKEVLDGVIVSPSPDEEDQF
ncbi:hypothetical protein TSUD_410310 [Trifolium subterraneum]|uniref:Transposase (putative) gypsy type domain-containing protein n=1 Tax=Trifolium subterraneum TaxID=3900 RepID=A0A2Z6P7D8_TRISU|nr:hypothetical protein TSUD_410310 [Trifolium subterraneum]